MTTETLPISPTVIVHDEKAATRARSSSNGQSLSGTLWFIGWLFTIGFARLVWWKALLAVILWPYFLGITTR